MLKDFLFEVFGYLGMAVIILVFLWTGLELLNRIFKFSKYIIMYFSYKKNAELYDIRNNIIVNKYGNVLYSCAYVKIEDMIDILETAVDKLNTEKQTRIRLREKYNK